MKYEVEVTRISYASEIFLIEADNEEQAQELAMDKAYNTGFYNEYSAEYEIDSCIPVDEDDEDEED